MISWRGGLHDNTMLVSVLASARKFIGCPGTDAEKEPTGQDRAEEVRRETGGTTLICLIRSTLPSFPQSLCVKGKSSAKCHTAEWGSPPLRQCWVRYHCRARERPVLLKGEESYWTICLFLGSVGHVPSPALGGFRKQKAPEEGRASSPAPCSCEQSTQKQCWETT